MTARRFSLSLAATAAAAMLVLTGCSSAAEPDASASSSTSASAAASASASESATTDPAAGSDQSVEEACTVAENGLTDSIADLPSISDSINAGDFATADASLKTVTTRLEDVSANITNAEVNAAFTAFVAEFTAAGPVLEEMAANADDPAKIEELKAEFSTFGSGAATEAMGELCPGS